MSYWNQTDLENALSVETVFHLYNDGNVGTVSAIAIADVGTRSSAMAESWLAPVYGGPWPITQAPLPVLLKELAIQYGIIYSYQRDMDYVHSMGEKLSLDGLMKRADMLGERMQASILMMPDYTAEPKARNVGGIVYDNGPRTMVDNLDGSSNAGDF